MKTQHSRDRPALAKRAGFPYTSNERRKRR
nr:MAG TPA: hypothetical protein [Caudoviricetes sp.]